MLGAPLKSTIRLHANAAVDNIIEAPDMSPMPQFINRKNSPLNSKFLCNQIKYFFANFKKLQNMDFVCKL